MMIMMTLVIIMIIIVLLVIIERIKITLVTIVILREMKTIFLLIARNETNRYGQVGLSIDSFAAMLLWKIFVQERNKTKENKANGKNQQRRKKGKEKRIKKKSTNHLRVPFSFSRRHDNASR